MIIMPSDESSQSKEDIATEYAFDYEKAKPNRFAAQDTRNITCNLDGRLMATLLEIKTAIKQLPKNDIHQVDRDNLSLSEIA